MAMNIAPSRRALRDSAICTYVAIASSPVLGVGVTKLWDLYAQNQGFTGMNDPLVPAALTMDMAYQLAPLSIAMAWVLPAGIALLKRRIDYKERKTRTQIRFDDNLIVQERIKGVDPQGVKSKTSEINYDAIVGVKTHQGPLGHLRNTGEVTLELLTVGKTWDNHAAGTHFVHIPYVNNPKAIAEELKQYITSQDALKRAVREAKTTTLPTLEQDGFLNP